MAPTQKNNVALPKAVAENVQHAALIAQRRAQSPDRNSEQDIAEVRDGRVGQQPLQVVLNEIEGERDEDREQRHAGHQRGDLGRHRPPAAHRPGHQVDAGFDHRRGVQIGADRSRSLHRIRQPRVQRDLGRLGPRRNQDEYEDPVPQPGRQCGQCRKLEGAGACEKNQHGQQQERAAALRHQHRLESRAQAPLILAEGNQGP